MPSVKARGSKPIQLRANETLLAETGHNAAMKLLPLSSLQIRSALFAALVPLALLMSGCLVVAAGAAGAGTVAYIRGELDATVSASLDRMDVAANAALQELQFVKVNESRDALAADITARTALDKKISIRLTKTGDTMTRIQIRVGLFGDETVSRTLLDQIRDNL